MRLQRPALLLVPLVALFLGPHPRGLAGQDVTARAASVRIGGRLHAQYTRSSIAGSLDDLFLRRARLTVDAALSDRLTVRLQPEFAGGTGKLKDAWARLDLRDDLALTVGQFKRPFDLFGLESSTDLSIIERDGRVEGLDDCAGVGLACSYSRFTEQLELAERDLGVRVDGGVGRVTWSASVTNGAGANTSDENDAKSFAGRVGVALDRGWSVGAQVAVHDYVGPDDPDAMAPAWSADVQYGDWRDGVHLQAAVVGGENWRNLDDDGAPSDFRAVQGVASVFLPLGDGEGVVTALEPLARVSFADPDTGLDDDAGLLVTPGVMLYLGGKNKIGANLDVYSPQGSDTETSLKLQTFLYF